MVSGIAGGFLCVHAVERHGNAETCWVAGGSCESNLSGVTHRSVAAASGGCERRIGPRPAEEVKKCRRANKFSVESGDRASEQHAERLRGDDLHAAGVRSICSGGKTRGRSDDGQGIGESQTGGVGEFEIVGEQLWVGGIYVH